MSRMEQASFCRRGPKSTLVPTPAFVPCSSEQVLEHAARQDTAPQLSPRLVLDLRLCLTWRACNGKGWSLATVVPGFATIALPFDVPTGYLESFDLIVASLFIEKWSWMVKIQRMRYIIVTPFILYFKSVRRDIYGYSE
ncbi:hypothetical protein BV25DRAFT_728813 [Artomyces pyxidatus]|uniref:Uncharacterized protein n=1 Tax=Artomyces pyxidatus TaxID=48021 RepID=A0ACB8T0M1_9AGAM|nr:hypothetical protein BV25DRAFT_728813 [Artomyces pyxidatus]